MERDEERLVVPMRQVEEPDPFPIWMWVAAVGAILLAAGGVVILMRMGVHH
jgi:hypothetical protein